MRQLSAQQIYNELISDNIINSTGNITLNLNNISVQISTKDSVGHMIQDWLEAWARTKRIYLRSNPLTQEFPDFYLSTSNDTNFLEIKSFDSDAGPNFDISNFDTYVRSLIHKPTKLDSDFLIFGYTLNNGILTIKNIWIKKIWELSTRSADWALKLQVKQNVIHNIRPVNFASTGARYTAFGTKLEFLNAIQDVLNNYRNTATSHTNWLRDFKQVYFQATGINL
jgi:hypothetical protein